MNIRKTIPFLAAALIATFVATPVALGADLTDVGYIDQAAIGSLPQFARANSEVAQYKSRLDAQFQSQIKSAKSDAARQRIAGDFQQRFLNKQREVLGPLFARAQTAIAQVSSSQHLGVIVDKRIVVYGGVDITKNVVDLVNGPGQVVPPSATPPPADVGYIDQTQIDQVPKIKKANDDFVKFESAQRAQAIKDMQAAKNDKSKQQTIFQNYQKSLSDQQNKMLKPLVDQTRDAMGSVARQKHLILVIDRSDIIYGGVDITKDVQNALSK
jgi:outer membrane protein